MQHHVRLGLPHDGGFLDFARVNTSGVIRIVGWSPLPDVSTPAVEGTRYLWSLRFQRDDVPKPNAGVFHDFLIDRSPVTLGDIEISALRPSDPPYAAFLESDRVYSRKDIYGTGPSITFVDSQLARLYEVVQGRALDFGCGSGAVVDHLQRAGVDARGIDLDAEPIRRAVLPAARKHVSFYDGNRLPFDDDSFDWVCASEVFEHIDNLDHSLTEVARVGRNLVMTVPDATAIVRLAGSGVVPWHLLEATHVNFFSPRNLRAKLATHFSDVTIGQIHNAETNGDVWSVNLWAIARR